MAKKNLQAPLYPSNTPVPEEEEISTFRYILQILYRLRGLIISVPVMVAALVMAYYSSQILPAQVGIFMLPSGSYQFYFSRSMAILIPLVITSVCVTFTLIAKKVTFPWCISLFSLLLPALLWLTSALTS